MPGINVFQTNLYKELSFFKTIFKFTKPEAVASIEFEYEETLSKAETAHQNMELNDLLKESLLSEFRSFCVNRLQTILPLVGVAACDGVLKNIYQKKCNDIKRGDIVPINGTDIKTLDCQYLLLLNALATTAVDELVDIESLIKWASELQFGPSKENAFTQ